MKYHESLYYYKGLFVVETVVWLIYDHVDMDKGHTK